MLTRLIKAWCAAPRSVWLALNQMALGCRQFENQVLCALLCHRSAPLTHKGRKRGKHNFLSGAERNGLNALLFCAAWIQTDTL